MTACLLSSPMRRVEQRLIQWADEYRDHPTRAWTILSRLIQHKGFIPDSRGFLPVPIHTQADEIESIVINMSRHGMHVEALVLRCEYFDRHSPDDARLQHLRSIGVTVSKRGYYRALDTARAYVAGRLEKAA